jgi:hypothetical protein
VAFPCKLLDFTPNAKMAFFCRGFHARNGSAARRIASGPAARGGHGVVALSKRCCWHLYSGRLVALVTVRLWVKTSRLDLLNPKNGFNQRLAYPRNSAKDDVVILVEGEGEQVGPVP